MDETLNSEPRLSFPIRMAPESWGDMEEYEIPTNQKAAVLKRLYPFDPVPKMDDVMFDLHAERTFRVSDFRVVRDCE